MYLCEHVPPTAAILSQTTYPAALTIPEKFLTVEHVAYQSADWDGQIEHGFIIDDGTQGWCFTLTGDSVFHSGTNVVIRTLEYDAREYPVKLHSKDQAFQSFN